MDVLKISDSKIKIMLTPSDVKRFRLDEENYDSSDKRIRKKVWDILDEIKAYGEFDPSAGKLLIQFYPSRDGGAELFVTKLTDISRSNERALSRSRDVTLLGNRKSFYRFLSKTDLIKVARILKGAKRIPKSNLFTDCSETFYLEVSERGASRLECISEFAVLLEFADPIFSDISNYINEHCTQIADGDAIDRLAELEIGVHS